MPARLLEYNALPARFEAWLNLSQREKARLLVMVRTRAIAIAEIDHVSNELRVGAMDERECQ